MKHLLQAKDLCKTFSNESVQQHVLKNLNITIDSGDFVVIMGNSGSGKSTLLYGLSGMDRPPLVLLVLKEMKSPSTPMINSQFLGERTVALYISRIF